MTRRGTSLRLRLAAGSGLLAALAILAAFLSAYGVRQALWLGEDAAGAQRRIDAYTTLSARVTAVVLTQPDRRAEAVEVVLADFQLLDRAIGADIAAARGDMARSRAAQGEALGRLRGAFLRLAEDLDRRAGDGVEREAALTSFSLIFAPLLHAQIEYNTLRRNESLAALDRLRARMAALSVGVALAVGVVLVLLYLLLVAPLTARLSSATRAIASAAPGGRPTALPLGPRDELGLLFARVNQMLARLDRRRRAVAADRAALETLVAERTAALAQANDRLAQTDEDRRRFFADVSHELRTPLTVILAETELAAANCPPALEQSLATIRSRAVRLNRRIEDLLRIARSETGQLEFDPQPLDLGQALDAALEDMRPLLTRARLAVERHRAGPAVVRADPDWLRQILGGLIGNAVKHAGTGATLHLFSGCEAGRAVCAVTDDGPGLPPDRRHDPATRFGGNGAPGAGSFGIGLALARWVTEAQGGQLGITSPVVAGRGFAVRIELPLMAPAKAAALHEGAGA